MHIRVSGVNRANWNHIGKTAANFSLGFPYLNQHSSRGLNSCSSTSLALLQAPDAELWGKEINQHFIAPMGSVDQTELCSETLKPP